MSDERIRLFVALTLPDQVRDALVAWRADAVGALGGLRLLDQEQLHVTLCFLGWQSSDTVEIMIHVCTDAFWSAK